MLITITDFYKRRFILKKNRVDIRVIFLAGEAVFIFNWRNRYMR